VRKRGAGSRTARDPEGGVWNSEEKGQEWFLIQVLLLDAGRRMKKRQREGEVRAGWKQVAMERGERSGAGRGPEKNFNCWGSGRVSEAEGRERGYMSSSVKWGGMDDVRPYLRARLFYFVGEYRVPGWGWKKGGRFSGKTSNRTMGNTIVLLAF